MVLRVVIAKDYDRSLARPLFNCPACFEKKEQSSKYVPSSSVAQPADHQRRPGEATG